jgi:hypothetical protein
VSDSLGPQSPRRWRSGPLGRLVLVQTGDVDGDEQVELVAVAGRHLKVWGHSPEPYTLRWSQELPHDALSLAVGPLLPDGPDAMAVGTRDRILLYTVGTRGVHLLCQTLLYPGAAFRDLTVTDINGDGQAEIVAAASGAQSLYLFGTLVQGGQSRLEELGRIPLGPVATVAGLPGGVATGGKDGHLDVWVPTAMLPKQGRQVYAVRRGDTLWRIARRHGCTVAAIARANGLQEPYALRPGQLLVIPPAGR